MPIHLHRGIRPRRLPKAFWKLPSRFQPCRHRGRKETFHDAANGWTASEGPRTSFRAKSHKSQAQRGCTGGILRAKSWELWTSTAVQPTLHQLREGNVHVGGRMWLLPFAPCEAYKIWHAAAPTSCNSSKIHFVGNRPAASSTTHARLWSSPSNGDCGDDWERACLWDLSASQWRCNHFKKGAGGDFESVGINAFRCSGWGSVRQTHQRSLPQTHSRSLERAQNASLPVRKQSRSEGYCKSILVLFCSAMYDGRRIFPRSNLGCQAMLWRWVASCGGMLPVELFESFWAIYRSMTTS